MATVELSGMNIFFLQTKSISQNKFRVLRINCNHDKWDTCDYAIVYLLIGYYLQIQTLSRYELGLSTQTLILATPNLIDWLSAMRHASRTAGKFAFLFLFRAIA